MPGCVRSSGRSVRRYVFCHVRDASIHVGELLTRLVGGRSMAPVACTAEGFRPDQETGLVSEIPLGSHAPGPRHPRLFFKTSSPHHTAPRHCGGKRIAACFSCTRHGASPETFQGRPHWFAGCAMLVAGGLEVSDPPAVCYRRLSDDGESLVSRKVHQLLRVPPTGSSASEFTKNTTSCRFFLANAVCWCCDSHPANQSWKEKKP